jgi:hypothetical protein
VHPLGREEGGAVDGRDCDGGCNSSSSRTRSRRQIRPGLSKLGGLKLDTGSWILEVGYWILDIGYWISDGRYVLGREVVYVYDCIKYGGRGRRDR